MRTGDRRDACCHHWRLREVYMEEEAVTAEFCLQARSPLVHMQQDLLEVHEFATGGKGVDEWAVGRGRLGSGCGGGCGRRVGGWQ